MNPQIEKQRRQSFRASGHRVRSLMWRCMTSEWSFWIWEWQRVAFLVCGTDKVDGIWREIPGNKGKGLKVHSFWTIPGTRIPVPRDLRATLPVHHLWFILFKGLSVVSKTTVLASSSSAVQTCLKNNTFLSAFICCSGVCSYFWVVLVADWNLLPLFPLSVVSEGIKDVYCGEQTLQGQLYTIDPSWWLKQSWASHRFSTSVISGFCKLSPHPT